MLLQNDQPICFTSHKLRDDEKNDAQIEKECRLDESDRRVVLNGRLPHIFGLAVLGDRLYWTDWQERAIESVNKRTLNDRQTIIDTML